MTEKRGRTTEGEGLGITEKKGRMTTKGGNDRSKVKCLGLRRLRKMTEIAL